MPKTMGFTTVFDDFLFSTLFAKIHGYGRCACDLGGLGSLLGGVLGASRGLFRGRKGPLGRILGATWGLLGASWGPPGAISGPKKALGGLLKVPKTIVFTTVFGIFTFWAVLLRKT